MNSIKVLVTSAALAVGLAGCGSSGGGGGGGGNAALNGTWEAELSDKPDAGGTLKKKVAVTFNGDKYSYSWFSKLVDASNNPVYDWSETARESGAVSASTDFMQWTADSFAEAEYNAATRSWGSLQSKSSGSGYNIQYKLDGTKLTLKEDINLDGDFEDNFDTPETIVYTKK